MDKNTKGEKNPGGRPPKYEDAVRLANKIQHYFDTITITSPAFDTVFDGKDDDDKDIFKRVPRLNNADEQVQTTTYFENPSVLGLCRHLGITRETLSQYEKDEKFSDTIKRAKANIEQFLEDQLYRREQVAGIIFNLKNNFGWKDKTEQEISGNLVIFGNEDKLED